MTVWYRGESWMVTGSYWSHLYLRSADGRETCVAEDDPDLQREAPTTADSMDPLVVPEAPRA